MENGALETDQLLSLDILTPGPLSAVISSHALRGPGELVDDQGSWLGLFLFLSIGKRKKKKQQDNSFLINRFFLGLSANEVGWGVG